tara:strand:- start:58 stop:219 length:162 start_codon:yes stop_codon:yes gene_type:complete
LEKGAMINQINEAGKGDTTRSDELIPVGQLIYSRFFSNDLPIPALKRVKSPLI